MSRKTKALRRCIEFKDHTLLRHSCHIFYANQVWKPDPKPSSLLISIMTVLRDHKYPFEVDIAELR